MKKITPTLSKVAEVTLAFWVIKILATTLGETAGDYLSMTLNLGYYIGLAITFSALLAILFIQIRTPKYYPTLFWLSIIATTTAGTEVSDFMDRSLGLGYMVGSAILATGLAATLAYWYRTEGNLKVSPINTRRQEVLFWVAVVFSNSLGTAFGDFLVDNLNLSYLQGSFVTAGVIALLVALHYGTKLNTVMLFWLAFVFTRPFGATFGDFLTKPLVKGGLDLPRDTASLVTFGLLLLLIALSDQKKKG